MQNLEEQKKINSGEKYARRGSATKPLIKKCGEGAYRRWYCWQRALEPAGRFLKGVEEGWSGIGECSGDTGREADEVANVGGGE
mmetsp:Transcript_13225/g.28686  ORF Transcript_13225/g.28686 Transcript_13225/m.28686 type:complete len:84 (-) Transcript_13225:71-322(-)